MKPALIFLAGLALGAVLATAALGRYSLHVSGAERVANVYRIDHWTGDVQGQSSLYRVDTGWQRLNDSAPSWDALGRPEK
jgi:hypothetical protein